MIPRRYVEFGLAGPTQYSELRTSTQPESDTETVEPRTSTQPEGDLGTVEPPAEGNGGTQQQRVLSPEEVAREFLREGRVVAVEEQNAEGRRRVMTSIRIAIGAGVAAFALVLALLAFLVLVPDRSPSPPSASKPSPGLRRSTPATNPDSLPPIPSVQVDVLNADGSGQRPTATYLALRSAGFTVSAVGTAPSLIASGQPSEIFYGPSGLAAAEILAYRLIGAVRDVYNANLPGNQLELWIATPLLGVLQATTTTTTTTRSTPPTP
jgi:LytR cell envelope-related transcriptional attenuator